MSKSLISVVVYTCLVSLSPKWHLSKSTLKASYAICNQKDVSCKSEFLCESFCKFSMSLTSRKGNLNDTDFLVFNHPLIRKSLQNHSSTQWYLGVVCPPPHPIPVQYFLAELWANSMHIIFVLGIRILLANLKKNYGPRNLSHDLFSIEVNKIGDFGGF